MKVGELVVILNIVGKVKVLIRETLSSSLNSTRISGMLLKVEEVIPHLLV